MVIDINQEKISLEARYRIYLDENEEYSAVKKFLRLLDEINLYNSTGGRPRLALKQKWDWFKTSYDIVRYDHNKFEFRTVSIWNQHYECEVGPDLYEIFRHRGRKFSIYKNDNQIAWWEKGLVSWFSGDNYKIIADNDCDAELLVCFCLIMDNSKSNQREGTMVNFDYGYFGPQAMKFNPDWQSKSVITDTE